MSFRSRATLFAPVALLAMVVTLTFAVPRAEAQFCLSVTTGDQLAACIEGYNAAPAGADITISLAADFALFDQLPDVQNLSSPPAKLSIFGNGQTIDGLGQSVGISLFEGDLSVYSLTVVNAATGLGVAGGSALVFGSTFVDNGNGLVVIEPGRLNVLTSTIAGNNGGIRVIGQGSATGVAIAQISFSTIVGNEASGGVYGEAQGLVEIYGSLIAANGPPGDCRGDFLVDLFGGNTFGDATCTGVPAPGLSGTFDNKLDFNGCTLPCTRTVALFAGSPAVDAFSSCPNGLVDQRGVDRPGGQCDSGAFEFATYCNDRLVTIDMNTNGGNGTGTQGDDVILGTDLNDLIDAAGGDDVICAGDGDDTVNAGPGDDLVSGGIGDDRLFGSQGDDVLLGLDGDDTIFGEDGRDIARGNTGSDTIDGGPGNDRLLGGIGDDELNGGDGDDYLGGFGGADTINGGAGVDTIFGGFGADTIDGGTGDDVIRGLIGNDMIRGGIGDDTLDGDSGNDIIEGGPGNDIIGGGNANDILDGGSGNDTVSGGKADDQLSGGPDTDTCIGNLQTTADTADATCETIFGVP